MLRTQFKMEMLVYSQDGTYSSSLNESQEEENELGHKHKGNKSSHRAILYSTDNHATLQQLMLHLKSYYRVSDHLEENESVLQITKKSTRLSNYFYFLLQIASQRLANQIPLVIRYQMLQETAMQLQREMLQMLQDKENLEFWLKEDADIGTKRATLQSRLKRLMQARAYLVEF